MVKSCQGWSGRLGLVAWAMNRAIPFGIASSFGAASLTLHAFSGNRAFAQVTSDDTLGTRVNRNLEIRGGTTVGGTNLFHSFSSFSVPDGQTAQFRNNPTIINIFGRVTGGTPSKIRGTIEAHGQANLFLINPSGIIFGPKARLDIGGSFVGTTANAIQFADGGEFSMTSAVDARDSVLRVNPSALIFNQIPGPIVNRSIAPNPTNPNLKDGLRVRDGQNLFLVGGEVRLEGRTIRAPGGRVRAPGGRVQLGGLAEAGVVGIEDATADSSNPTLNFPDVGLRAPDGVARANVSLSAGAVVNVRAGGGGDIAIGARDIDVSGGSRILAGIASGRGSRTARAGNIVLDATGEVRLSQLSSIANNVNANATGNNKANIFQAVTQARETGDPSVIFGSIFITTNSLSITDGASVSTTTFGTGNAGLVYVDAEDSVSVAGFQDVPTPGLPEPERVRSQLASAVGSGARGNAGGIFIETGSLSLTDYSLINSSTSGAGTAGAVVVEADGAVSLANDSVIFNNVEAGGNGNGGLISLTAESLSLTNGAQLQTIARNVEKGNAGAVTVNVRDTVTISGTGNPLFGNQGVALPSGIFSSVGSGVNGNAGNIAISAESIALSDRGQINTNLYGTGTPGSIFLKATDSISLNNGANIRSVIEENAVATDGTNPYSGEISGSLADQTRNTPIGSILISTGGLSLKNNSLIDASTFGRGDAGAVIVVASDAVSLRNGSAIDSRVEPTGIGNAGGILMAVESLSIEGSADNPSRVSTSALGRRGNPGRILVLAEDDITLSGGADDDIPRQNRLPTGIFSQVGEENTNPDVTGGGILLDAKALFLNEGARVSVSNIGGGEAGDVVITAEEDIILKDEGQIAAIAASGRGGNIVLTSGDFLLLLDESQIRTDAFNLNNPNGNGGNIFAVTKYLIAAPYNTNDIIANAIQDVGGNIFVLAGRIYDIEERPQVVPTNDIDASSDFNRDGTVSASDLNIDPTQGFTNLPANLIDPSSLIAETCAPRGSIAERKNNQFTNTGPGGLPPDPNAAFPGEAVVNDLEVPEENERNNTEEGNSTGEPSSANPTNLPPVETASSQDPTLVEAQGWVYGENGTVLFTAQASTVTPNSPVLRPASTCNNVSTSLQPR